MLGFVGDRFAKLSATAFSIAFTIALTGNIIVNYIVGQISKTSGIGNLVTVIAIEYAALVITGLFIFRKRRTASVQQSGTN